MVIEGETGLFTVPKDTKTLKESLSKLLADSELCRTLGENARRKAETEFSMDNNIKQLLTIYEVISCKESHHEKR